MNEIRQLKTKRELALASDKNIIQPFYNRACCVCFIKTWYTYIQIVYINYFVT